MHQAQLRNCLPILKMEEEIFCSCGIMKTLAFVLNLEENEEFKLVDIGGAIRGEEIFGRQ